MIIPRPVRFRDVEWRIYANFDGSNWEDISDDVLEGEGVAWDRGMSGGGPTDLTARAGTLTFALNNSHRNSVRVRGNWTPGSVPSRNGWDVGTPLRLDLAFQGRWVTQWIGRADEITPEHGILGARRVYVSAKDWMEEAAEHKLKGLETLDNVTAVEVIEELLSVMPIQPPGGTVLDEGLDTFPIAFDDVRDGKTTVMTELAKLNRSDLSLGFITKEGALRYMNRNTRLASTHNLFVLDGTMRDVLVTRSRKNIVNRVEVTVHPRRVSTDYVVLSSLDSQPIIPPGETVPFRLEYHDPENPGERIGAVDVQDLVAGQDYIGSIQQALATGTPDTPATLEPLAVGHYTAGSTGSVADLSNGDDDDGMSPAAALVRHSVTLTDLTAASNAAVSSVRIPVRVKNSPQGAGGFFVLYVEARLNGIDMPVFRTGTTINHLDGETAGMHAATFEVPLAPGGSVWNVSGANALEIVWYWNWGGDLSALPLLADLDVSLLYASAVEELDRTADLSVALPNGKGGNATDFLVTNNGTEGVYLTRLQIRGRPVFKYDPVTSFVEDATSIAAIGEKLVSVDQSYQDDINRGVQTAEYLLYQYGPPNRNRAESVSFLANLSEEHMNAALDREIGDRIGLAEEVTGLSAFTADGAPMGWYIQGVSGRILPGPVVEITWPLAPADAQQYWHAEVEGQSELQDATTPGPL